MRLLVFGDQVIYSANVTTAVGFVAGGFNYEVLSNDFSFPSCDDGCHIRIRPGQGRR